MPSIGSAILRVVPAPARNRLWAFADRSRRKVRIFVKARGRRPPVCTDIAAWAATHPDIECWPLLAPREVSRRPPRTVEPEVAAAYLQRISGTQAGRCLVRLDGARLVGPEGLVMLPDGHFAAESVYATSVLERVADYPVPAARRLETREGTYFSLVVIWLQSNYYHWLHDTVLRLFGVLAHLPPDTRFVVPANITPLQRETLAVLGIGDDRLVPYDGDQEWALETLYFAPATTQSGSDRPDADRWLRDQFLAGYDLTLGPAQRRLYISRRRAQQRRVTNEAEVEELVRAHGFEVVIAEDMPLRDQVELFTQAEIVVGTHGAGLTNTLFAPPGLRIVDMIQPRLLENAYIFWSMAEALDHEYWYFVTDSVPRAGNQNDSHVPIDKLQATFEQMGLAPRP